MEPFQQQDFPLRPFSVQRGLPPGSMPSVRVVPYVACRIAIDSISPAQSICALLLADEPMGNLDTESDETIAVIDRRLTR